MKDDVTGEQTSLPNEAFNAILRAPASGMSRFDSAALSSALPVICVTMFLSAFLLFSVQPIFAKLILPKLGGTPAVWSVAMVFFQAVLLAGYAYAHVIATRLTTRRAALIHIALMVVTLGVALPLGLMAGAGRPPETGQALWLILVFAGSVGLPFFAVSANGPLLQAWFARTGHPHAQDPYFLYAASNVGSLLALLSYPVIIEPFLSLGAQSLAWTWGFALLIAGIAGSAAFAVGPAPMGAAAIAAAPVGRDAASPSWADRARWTALAFVPSALLVAVTAYISTDVAAAPLLWVLPLALFLSTFIIVFQRQPILRHQRLRRIHLILVGGLLAPMLVGAVLPWQFVLPLHLAGFFVAAMICHGEMAERRPDPRHLTSFYMWMSFGGVLGGLFAGLIAPHVFSTVLEYPLLIMAAVLCHPGLFEAGAWRRNLRTVGFFIVGGGLAALALVAASQVDSMRFLTQNMVLAAVSLALVSQYRHPARVVGAALAALVVMIPVRQSGGDGESIRSFFGVHKISNTPDGQYRLLSHGTTLHGAQRIRDEQGRPIEGPPEPITYYHAKGNISVAIDTIRAALGGLRRVAAVGVGTGSLACRRQAGESWTFYEIDQSVVDIARDPNQFGFLSSCAPDAGIVLGDARLTLADAPDGSLDLLVVDAFSSDAIPAHLLTVEAVALYVSKLTPRGSIIIHISNRNMELASVVAAVGQRNGLETLHGTSDTHDDVAGYRLASQVAVLTRSRADVGELPVKPGWRVLSGAGGTRAWTDDYADLTGAIWRRLRRE